MQLLEKEIIETKANCENCYRSGNTYRGKYPYRSDLKCCTFEPFLPNFLVGAILSENKNTEAVKHKICNHQFSLPIGITPTLKYQVQFNKRTKNQFGQDEKLLCSYYDRRTHHCTIWKNRGVVCTTYYCISDKGPQGLQFWKSLNNYLSYVEMALMEECLVQMDFSPKQVSELLIYINRKKLGRGEVSTFLPKEKGISLWNGYYNEQEKFFIKCHEIASTLKPVEFNELLGGLGKNLLKSISL